MVRREEEVVSLAELWNGNPVFKDLEPYQLLRLGLLYEKKIGWDDLTNVQKKKMAHEIAGNLEAFLSSVESIPLLNGWANRENGRENAVRHFANNSPQVQHFQKKSRLFKLTSAALTGLLILSAWEYQRQHNKIVELLKDDRKIINTQQDLLKEGQDLATKLVKREKEIKTIVDRILKDPQHVDPKDIEALRKIMNPPSQAKGR